MLLDKDNSNYYESRLDFPRMINEHGWKVGVEVGVFKGEYSEHLLEHSNLETLYSVDKWRDHLGDSEYYPPQGSQKECYQRLKRFGERSIMWRKESIEASWDFKNKTLDFVYIDAGHDAINVMHDLGIWWKKVRPGGFFGGHDYMVMPHEGASVVFLVDMFAGLMGQQVRVTGAKDSSPEERHRVACMASVHNYTIEEFEPPSWWIIRD